jgi:hypothetical protein
VACGIYIFKMYSGSGGWILKIGNENLIPCKEIIHNLNVGTFFLVFISLENFKTFNGVQESKVRSFVD